MNNPTEPTTSQRMAEAVRAFNEAFAAAAKHTSAKMAGISAAIRETQRRNQR